MLLTSWLMDWPGSARANEDDWPRTRRRLRRYAERRTLAHKIESLEIRLVPTTISLNVDGNLLIDTSDNTSFDQDQLEIRADVTNSKFIISDPNQTLITSISAAVTSSNPHIVELPFSSVSSVQKLFVNTFAGDDRVTLSAVGGSFGLSPVIDAGAGFDEINVLAGIVVTSNSVDLLLSAENIQLGGDLTTNGGKITLDGNVILINNVTLSSVGTSAAAVQINGQLDSAPGPSNYTLITTPRTYADAQSQAGLDVPGGYLATIRSQSEQAAVKSTALTNDVWIGASDAASEGKWNWDAGPDFGVQFWNGDGVSGTSVNNEYSNWFSGEPDDAPFPADAAFLSGSDTLISSGDPGRWSDGDNTVPRAYIVEAPTAFSLTVNSGTASLRLNGPVGNILPLRFLNVTAGQTNFAGGSISTFKSQTYNSAVALSGPTLMRANEVDFGGGSNSVSGTVSLTLAPIKRDAPITVGATSDLGTASFDITDTDIAALAVGFLSILVGEPTFNGGDGSGGGTISSGGTAATQSIGPVTITSSVFQSPVAIAGGSISVTGLDAGTNKVDLMASLGSITDGDTTAVDITAGELSLDSSTGVGASSDALETSASSISARAARSGDVVIANSGNLLIGSPSSPGGIFTNGGVASVSTTGSMTVAQFIKSNGGNVALTATDGISIKGVPIETAVPGGPGGQFTADADSNNDGSGTFSITSFTDFVDWTSPSQGTFADGTVVDLIPSTFAIATAHPNGGDTRFNDPTIYSPPQASGDIVETHFSQPSAVVTFSFRKTEFGLFLQFDGMQIQDPSFNPATSNPINLYSFDHVISKASGETTWDIDAAATSIQQIAGNHLADQDGTVRFDGGVNSLTLTRVAPGVNPGPGGDNLVNVQLGLFRAGGIKANNNSITIRAADVNLDGFLDAGTDLVTLTASGTNRPINLGTETTGSLSLTDAELDQIRAGTLQVGDATSGVITISGNITRPAATDVTLTTGANNDIRFTGANATLDANGGNVTLLLNSTGTGAVTSGDALPDIRGKNVVLGSGSLGVGAAGNPLVTDATSLVVVTSGNAPAFLQEIDKVTIASVGLSAGSGVITLTRGTYSLGGSNRIDDLSPLVVGAAAKFQLNGSNESLISLKGTGSVSNGSATAATLSVNLAGNEAFGGVLGGTGTDENNFGLAKSGTGALTLTGTNTYTGDTVVNNGQLLINGSITSNVDVKTGAAVGGSGTIDSTHALVVETGATLAPGNSPGLLSVGTLTLQSGSTFNVELNGTIAGASYDQVHVTGSGSPNGLVTIGSNVTLNPTLGFAAAAGDRFVIINNDGSDAVSGTFNGLPSGSLLTINGTPFHIVYDFDSGDGNKNDVALIVNHNPVINDHSFSVDEQTSADSLVGTVVATDADSALTYAIIAGNTSNAFVLNAATGELRVNNSLALDAAVNPTISLTVEVTDDAGATATATIKVRVLSLAPTTPQDVDDHTNTVPEGSLEGSRVGITLFSSDAQGDNVVYRLTDDDGGRFAIDHLTGVVTVKAGRLLRFGDGLRHLIRAVAFDSVGHVSGEASFSLTVTEVPADALPLASILPTRVSVVEGDSGPNFITFLVKLNKPSDQTITIDFSTRLGTDPTFQRPEGISADTPFATDQPGSPDFFRSAGTLTFDPGVTEQPLRVQIRPDDTPEPNELFFVQLQSPVNVRLAPQQSVATAQILDDDSVPQLIVSNTQALEGDSAGQNELVFRVELIGDLPPGIASATTDYLTGNPFIDTAEAGVDYTAVSDTLTFTNLNRVREVHVPILGDLVDESNKSLTLRFQNPVNLALSRREVTGTIINDDSSTNVLASISPALFKVRENNSGSQPVEFIVTLIGKPSAAVSVNYATADGTATAGSDYAATSGTVEFSLADIAAGIVQKSVFVNVFGDTAIEPDESFTVALSLPSAAPAEVSIDPDLASGRVVIRNDDQAILTEDGDSLTVALSNDLTTILGTGPKNNPALLAELRARAVQIIQSQGLTKAIVIIVDPVDFVLTDSEGRQSGYTENTGVVNQIPGTYYSGDGSVELLITPLPPDGTYNVQLAGLGGDFNASITVVDSNGTSTSIVSDNLADGATRSVSFQVGGTTAIPVGLGLAAANSGAASTFGVVGNFGNSNFRLAMASAFEEGTSNEFNIEARDTLATGLVYWLTVSARAARQQILEPLWNSWGAPLGNLLGEGMLARTSIPSEFVDQFWSLVGQTLTGVPSGIYQLGNMLDSLIPTLGPNRNRPAPSRSGDQGQPRTPPDTGTKIKRSTIERPRSTPPAPSTGNGQTPAPRKPNVTKEKSAQAPDPKNGNGQQAGTSHVRWLWFTGKDEQPATRPTNRRGV